jgi:hypothetical protein
MKSTGNQRRQPTPVLEVAVWLFADLHREGGRKLDERRAT